MINYRLPPHGRQLNLAARLLYGLPEDNSALNLSDLRAAALTAQARILLARVRIADPDRALDAHPHAFSGGMRQRIMLASVMLLRPALLVAGEPTTALDTLTQREVLDLMVALTRTAGTAVLLITHDLGLVARYAARAVVLRQGRVVEAGVADDVLHRAQADYTRELLAAVPRVQRHLRRAQCA
jgi:peptide/nickel transport system ATP-binding protein